MAQPARVVETDVLQLRALREDFQQLVDLLLVFDDGEADIGVLQHEHHFGRDGVLVERHRHAAQGLRGHHGPVQARPVVADHREAVAALEPSSGKAAGENTNLVGDLSPGPGLPNAQVLLPERRPVGPYVRVVQQQARKSIGLFRHGALLGRLPPKHRRRSQPANLTTLPMRHEDFTESAHFGLVFNYTGKNRTTLMSRKPGTE